MTEIILDYDIYHASLLFPPYVSQYSEFPITGTVSNYGNENDVRDCYLEGRMDLYTAETIVQDVIADYLNDLLDMGVAGFRIDAATHIWPEVSIGYIRDLLIGAKHAVFSLPLYFLSPN